MPVCSRRQVFCKTVRQCTLEAGGVDVHRTNGDLVATDALTEHDERLWAAIAPDAVHGSLMYVDTDGLSVGLDDRFYRIEKYRAHNEAVGLGAGYVKTFMR